MLTRLRGNPETRRHSRVLCEGVRRSGLDPTLQRPPHSANEPRGGRAVTVSRHGPA